jgi:hypothetical protein
MPTVSTSGWNFHHKALHHAVSLHCAQKQQRAPLLGVDCNTVTRNCKALGVKWTEPLDRKAAVIDAPE